MADSSDSPYATVIPVDLQRSPNQGSGLRSRDLFAPNEARYQAAPYPVVGLAIRQLTGAPLSMTLMCQECLGCEPYSAPCGNRTRNPYCSSPEWAASLGLPMNGDAPDGIRTHIRLCEKQVLWPVFDADSTVQLLALVCDPITLWRSPGIGSLCPSYLRSPTEQFGSPLARSRSSALANASQVGDAGIEPALEVSKTPVIPFH